MPRIYDAVYGYVELDKFEFELVNSPIFQRLHWIKQLGPLHTVFPSAQHSRFSHTIGVFYIVNKMIEHLENRRDKYRYKFRKDKKQKELLKFAALLHDIGHVPLSHVGEEVLVETAEDKLKAKFLTKISDGTVDLVDRGYPSWWDLFLEVEYRGSSTKLHERLSAEIVLHSQEIDNVLSHIWRTKKAREKAKQGIAQIIIGLNYKDVPTLLLYSELDADRLDYLLRDSFFTGVGYGKIDLDYIISRLAIFRDEENVADLCVENKGLHAIEHYILGRFFLQTQVIFNRKVRFMDLVFRDVMKYMVNQRNENWRLMDLEEIRDCIRRDLREDLHRIYGYTDALVFSNMRKLHEELDKKEKEKQTTDEESYINDCVKTIMDGRIPEPAFPTCQRVIDLKSDEGYNDRLQEKADKVARKVAEKLGIYQERVKANIVEQELMKYKKRIEIGDSAEKESNREAVRIMYEKPGEGKKIKPAAESNATIISDLSDKALLIFNTYYVARKSESDEEIKAKRKAIDEAYRKFVSKEFKS